MTIARDSLDRLWITYTVGKPRRVYVAHSTTDHATWTPPFLVPVSDNTVATDDISAIAAFNGRIGVMWSDQTDQVMRFASHQTATPTAAGPRRSPPPDPTWPTTTSISSR